MRFPAGDDDAFAGDQAAEFGQRLDIEPPPRSDWFAVRAEDGRDLGIGNAIRSPVTIDDAAAQPGAVVGGAQKMTAIGLHVKGGYAAEGRVT